MKLRNILFENVVNLESSYEELIDIIKYKIPNLRIVGKENMKSSNGQMYIIFDLKFAGRSSISCNIRQEGFYITRYSVNAGPNSGHDNLNVINSKFKFTKQWSSALDEIVFSGQPKFIAEDPVHAGKQIIKLSKIIIKYYEEYTNKINKYYSSGGKVD